MLKLIQTITVPYGGSAILFSNIPPVGSDLLIKLSSRGSRSAAATDDLLITINGDSTTTNYFTKTMSGSGTGTSTTAHTGLGYLVAGWSPAAGATTNIFGNAEVFISNYNTTATKTVTVTSITENNAAESYVRLAVGKYTGTSKVTSVLLWLGFTTMIEGSTASLYSVKRGYNSSVSIT